MTSLIDISIRQLTFLRILSGGFLKDSVMNLMVMLEEVINFYIQFSDLGL